MIVDDEDAPADQRASTLSIPSTSRVRCDIQLTELRGSSRSAGDIRQIIDHSDRPSAVELSLRLSGCGAERSIKAKRRVIKVSNPCN